MRDAHVAKQIPARKKNKLNNTRWRPRLFIGLLHNAEDMCVSQQLYDFLLCFRQHPVFVFWMELVS